MGRRSQVAIVWNYRVDVVTNLRGCLIYQFLSNQLRLVKLCKDTMELQFTVTNIILVIIYMIPIYVH